MGTVIDSLVVELGLDPSKFTKGQDESVESLRKFEERAKKAGKNVERSAGDMTESFSLLQGKLLQIAALFMGGMGAEQFAAHLVKMGSSTGYLSQQLGVSAQELSKWEYAGKRVGATAQDIDAAFKSITSNRTEFQVTGNSQLASFAYSTAATSTPLKIFENGMSGAWLSSPQILMNLSKWAAGQKDKALAAHLLETRAGLSPGATSLVLQGPDKLNELLKESAKFVPTPQQIESFQRLVDAFAKATAASDDLGRAITEKFAPAIEGILKLFASETMQKVLRALSFMAVGQYVEALKTISGWDDNKSAADNLKPLLNGTPPARSRGLPMGQPPGMSGDGASSGQPPAQKQSLLTPDSPAATLPGGDGQMYNYFQKHGTTPPGRAAMETVQTAFGPITVNPQAAKDFKGAYDDLAAAGAPIKTLGSFNERRMRWSNQWSSHAYGAATDIDDSLGFSPQMKAWMQANPGKMDEILSRHNLGRPLPQKDPNHVEWRGPGSDRMAGAMKGSWFGSYHGKYNWSDPMSGTKTASGTSLDVPGIALPNRATLGKYFEVTTPDGRKFTLRQTDVGPAKWTGRGVDFTASAAEKMGYQPGNFPTDKMFSVRSISPDAWGAGAQPVPWLSSPGAMATATHYNNSATHNSSQTSIGNIEIHAPNSDASGIATALDQNLRRFTTITNSNNGPQ